MVEQASCDGGLRFGAIRAVAQSGELLVERLDRGFALFQQAIDERFLAVDQ
jgi:hypothetical protein